MDNIGWNCDFNCPETELWNVKEGRCGGDEWCGDDDSEQEEYWDENDNKEETQLVEK